MNSSNIKLEETWKKALLSEFDKDYMRNLKNFLVQEIKKKKKVIFPPGRQFFAAFDQTPLDCVKIVILGQDPYHGPHQAHGLCFSVRPKVSIPPSLVNIYKELASDIGFSPPSHGYLLNWANQGVLLLNATLSVEAGHAGSHQGKGWELFTDRAIEALNEQRQNLVFMLWGSYAQRKGDFINKHRHCILKAPHPSPLSAHRGFFGCKHFSKANAYLKQHDIKPIDWSLPMEMKFAHEDQK